MLELLPDRERVMLDPMTAGAEPEVGRWWTRRRCCGRREVVRQICRRRVKEYVLDVARATRPMAPPSHP